MSSWQITVANESLVLPKSKYGQNDQQTSIQYTEYNMALAICIVILEVAQDCSLRRLGGLQYQPVYLKKI